MFFWYNRWAALHYLHALDSHGVRGLQWAGQLGDGRAINLGAARGADGQLWELQLKVCCALLNLHPRCKPKKGPDFGRLAATVAEHEGGSALSPIFASSQQ